MKVLKKYSNGGGVEKEEKNGKEKPDSNNKKNGKSNGDNKSNVNENAKKNVLVKPSERGQYLSSWDEKKIAKQEAKEQKRAEKRRAMEEKKASSMSERDRKRYARQQAREERRMERQQMRANRKEQRQFRKTMRKKARQEAREERGLTYTGGRRISPRRWYKNLRDKLGLRVKQGSGRLRDYDQFKIYNPNPASYRSESGEVLDRGTRGGKIRSGKGKFEQERGMVTRYKKGGKVQDFKPGQVGTYGPAGDADPDQLTFGEAFAAAKRAGAKKFKWKGKTYTTETKDEKGKGIQKDSIKSKKNK